MVGEVGVAPTVFLMSRIYSPLPSLLGTLAHTTDGVHTYEVSLLITVNSLVFGMLFPK